jgi:hypothetical protein
MCKEQGTRIALVKTEPVTRIMCFYFTCLDDTSISSLTKHLANRCFEYEESADRIIYWFMYGYPD